MLQAEARAHRIGQKNPVTVYKLCTQGTVEEQMMGRIQKKLYLSAKVTESMRDIHQQSPSKPKKNGLGGKVAEPADDDMPQLDASQLMSLVRRGAQALAHPEINVNEMLEWDWPTMLEKCRDRPTDIHITEETQAGIAVKEEDEKRWLARIEQVESRVFDGKRHSKIKESNNYDGIAQEWSREARRVGKHTTVLVDGYAVSKESVNCADWEAVPTSEHIFNSPHFLRYESGVNRCFLRPQQLTPKLSSVAGKDPRLAEPKREKKPAVVNQEVLYSDK